MKWRHVSKLGPTRKFQKGQPAEKTEERELLSPIRACHVSSRWQSAGRISKIRFRLFRALNLQIAITIDPELGFARSLYQWKA
ncbi:hypothetical protein KI387_024100, partial [Taxus chinensis]